MLGQPARPGAGALRRPNRGNSWRRVFVERFGPEAASLLRRPHGVRQLAPGDSLAQARDAGSEFCIVKRGVAGLYRSGGAGELDVRDFRFPGDLILPTRPGVEWGQDVRAVSALRLLVFAFSDLESWCAADPELGCQLFEGLCGDLARRTERLRRHWCLPVQARLAAFLLEAGERIGERSDGALLVQMPIPRDEIANYLSTRTETVCRVLSAWRAEGLIEMDSPRHFRVPDPALLRARAAASQEARRKAS